MEINFFDEILQCIFIIFFAVFVVVSVIFNIAQAMYFVKCFKVKECSNRNCYFKGFCDKYESVWTGF